MENHRRTVHGMIEISKQRQTAVVNPTLKGKSQNVDYMPNTSSLGSLRSVFKFVLWLANMVLVIDVIGRENRRIRSDLKTVASNLLDISADSLGKFLRAI